MICFDDKVVVLVGELYCFIFMNVWLYNRVMIFVGVIFLVFDYGFYINGDILLGLF